VQRVSGGKSLRGAASTLTHKIHKQKPVESLARRKGANVKKTTTDYEPAGDPTRTQQTPRKPFQAVEGVFSSPARGCLGRGCGGDGGTRKCRTSHTPEYVKGEEDSRSGNRGKIFLFSAVEKTGRRGKKQLDRRSKKS